MSVGEIKAKNMAGPDQKHSTTRTEDVTVRLREMVLDGAFPPGTHLQEVVLASRLGVSRTPIRDALRVLGQEQLLTYSPNRGYFVTPFPAKHILDAFDVRATLEGMGCRLCAEQGITAGEERALRDILKKAEALFERREFGHKEDAEWISLNVKFHIGILEASCNKHLMAAAQLARRIPRVFDSRLEPTGPVFRGVYSVNHRWHSHLTHCAIVDAIVAGEGTRAEYLMREHVHLNREVLRKKLQERDPENTSIAPLRGRRES